MQRLLSSIAVGAIVLAAVMFLGPQPISAADATAISGGCKDCYATGTYTCVDKSSTDIYTCKAEVDDILSDSTNDGVKATSDNCLSFDGCSAYQGYICTWP